MKIRSNIYTAEHGMIKKKIHFVLSVTVEFTEEEMMLFDRVNAWEYPVMMEKIKGLDPDSELSTYHRRLGTFKTKTSWSEDEWDNPQPCLEILEHVRKVLPVIRDKLKLCGEQIVDV